MLFQDRREAGRRLAEILTLYKDKNPVVLALPRGGVPVGYEIAKRLNAPLDVLIVRKIGAPRQRELGIGAIAPGGIKVLDKMALQNLRVAKKDVIRIENEERRELERRLKVYRGLVSYPNLRDKIVILVDDGLATGVTAMAAIKFVLKKNPQKIIIALPVCAPESVGAIRSLIRPYRDGVVCLFTPYDMGAVGFWYRNFAPVSDEEVICLLMRAKSFPFLLI
ncbi:MAG: phosphoribosyltransferase [Candidatus Blackburnbacteria bacterium]|nr:phosphoribosyltransferase [Candidatus Blackburnbacteria bacterium]